ncbi:MAG: helix-turn-helix domain-containing protein [Akkermansia sp.]
MDSSHIGLVQEDNLNLLYREQVAIQAALLKSNGNRTLAAKLLGISRRTLQRKLTEDTTPHD